MVCGAKVVSRDDTMSALRVVAAMCYATNAFFLIVLGVRYLRSSEFLPYHGAALGRDWNHLDPRLQLLLLAMLRNMGGGFLALGLSTLALLVFPFREGAAWATYILPLSLLVAAIPSLVATRSVALATGAPVPERQVWIAIGFILLGFVLSHF
jgi:hypothetical protein